MACIQWKFGISVLMLMSSITVFFGSGYYFKSEKIYLSLLLYLIGCVFFFCGLFVYVNSFLVYQPPKANKEKNVSKRVRFSSYQQVYEHDERNVAENSNQRLLEEIEESDVMADDNNGDDHNNNESRSIVQTEDLMQFTATAKHSTGYVSCKSEDSESNTIADKPLKEEILYGQNQSVKYNNWLKPFHKNYQHELRKIASLIDFESIESDDSSNEETQETEL